MCRFLKILLIATLAFQATALNAQKNKKDKKDKAKITVADLLAEANAQADTRTAEIADEFGITAPEEKNKIKQACRKYYRGLIQLELRNSTKNSSSYQKRQENIRKDYYRALRKVLPQS